jgi:hypothetical protein
LQNAGPFGPELVTQLLVAFFCRMVTVNWIRLKRRRAASFTERKLGLWLPLIISLSWGTKLKRPCRMKRALTRSPPVSILMRLSAQRLPSSVSFAVTKRAPRRSASSVGWRSTCAAAKVSIGAVR